MVRIADNAAHLFDRETASVRRPSLADDFTFKATELDSGDPLQYSRSRWFDQATGGWLSTEPAGYSGDSVNVYPYVANDPTDVPDAMGL